MFGIIKLLYSCGSLNVPELFSNRIREPTRCFWSFWILNIFHIYQLAYRVLIVMCFTVLRSDMPMNWRSKCKIIAVSSSNQLQASYIAVKSPHFGWILAFTGLRPPLRPLTFLKIYHDERLVFQPHLCEWCYLIELKLNLIGDETVTVLRSIWTNSTEVQRVVWSTAGYQQDTTFVTTIW